jgi:hypothetical protein
MPVIKTREHLEDIYVLPDGGELSGTTNDLLAWTIGVTGGFITNLTDAERTIELTSDHAGYDTILFPVAANTALSLFAPNITAADIVSPGTGKWYLYATR